MNTIKEELLKFNEDIINYHIPRWEELPDLELYMDQVITFIEKNISIFSANTDEKIITPAMVNNYVKLKLIPQPVKKRYNKVHLAYLIAISILKHVFTIQEVRDGIIYQAKIQGERMAYNSFCEGQEEALRYLANHINPQVENANAKKGLTTENLAIQMATFSFASKVIAEKIIRLQNDIIVKNTNN